MSAVISAILLEDNAVKIDTEKPFDLSSGNKSPIYFDCRQVISDPIGRSIIISYAHAIVDSLESYPDVIAGGETAGIPYGSWLADELNLPFAYVRKKPKGHGTVSQIEGKINTGDTILLCEDLITDGESKIIIKTAHENIKTFLCTLHLQFKTSM